MKLNIIHILISIILLILLHTIINYYVVLYSNNYRSGTFIRTSGDLKQPKYFKRYDNKIIYYNDNKEIVDYANKSCFYSLGQCNYKHYINKSFSTYNTRKFYFGNIGKGIGFAENKHGRNNVYYKAFHHYYTIDNIDYYYNVYHFSDNTISSATYEKISRE